MKIARIYEFSASQLLTTIIILSLFTICQEVIANNFVLVN